MAHQLQLIVDRPQQFSDLLQLMPRKNYLWGGHLAVLTGILKFAAIIMPMNTNRKGQRTQLKLGLDLIECNYCFMLGWSMYLTNFLRIYYLQK